jgi:hypothetical protein
MKTEREREREWERGRETLKVAAASFTNRKRTAAQETKQKRISLLFSVPFSSLSVCFSSLSVYLFSPSVPPSLAAAAAPPHLSSTSVHLYCRAAALSKFSTFFCVPRLAGRGSVCTVVAVLLLPVSVSPMKAAGAARGKSNDRSSPSF